MYVSLGTFKISYVLHRENFPWLDFFFSFLKMTVFLVPGFKLLEMKICS